MRDCIHHVALAFIAALIAIVPALGQNIDAKLGGATASERFVVTDNALTPDSLFTVRGDGRVGIGTPSPDYLLDVNGPGTGTATVRLNYGNFENGSLFLRFTEENFRGAYLRYDATGNNFHIGVHEGDDTLSTSDDDIITLDRSTGYVGIGDSSPEYDLDILGSDTVVTTLAGSVGNSVTYVRLAASNFRGGYIRYDGNGNDFHIGVHDLDDSLPANDIDAISIDRGSGNLGIGTTPTSNPLHMASGAHVSSGGVWTNASSRRLKENIRELDLAEAQEALDALAPVRFNYKTDQDEEQLGFIAEDVPDLVASEGRKGLSSMDIVALLTRIVQDQQERIAALEARLRRLE